VTWSGGEKYANFDGEGVRYVVVLPGAGMMQLMWKGHTFETAGDSVMDLSMTEDGLMWAETVEIGVLNKEIKERPTASL
jgi:hypothetical protein